MIDVREQENIQSESEAAHDKQQDSGILSLHSDYAVAIEFSSWRSYARQFFMVSPPCSDRDFQLHAQDSSARKFGNTCAVQNRCRKFRVVRKSTGTRSDEGGSAKDAFAAQPNANQPGICGEHDDSA